MNINGTVIAKSPVIEGESNKGSWMKCGFAIETTDEYPKKVYFTVFGEERVAKVQALQMGEPVQVHFTPESREFNEKWYTDLRAYSITGMYAEQDKTAAAPDAPATYPQAPAPAPAKRTSAKQAPAPTKQATLDVDDDLPF